MILLRGSNNLGQKGCEYLTKNNWFNLNALILCKFTDILIESNYIGFIGAEYISKGDWPNLITLNLGKSFLS